MRYAFHQTLRLDDDARVGVIGGGPAGSLFSFFLLSLAERVDLKLNVDIYEPRDFARAGPKGCNMCGGIVSESLVEDLAMEGINLPSSVVQRGIDSYVLHADVGSVQIETPHHEMRIAAVHRGSGPRGREEGIWQSLDGFLHNLAIEKGARRVPSRVRDVRWRDDRPEIRADGQSPEVYDLVVGATGVNTTALKTFSEMETGYEPPATTKTFICEYRLDTKSLGKYLGSSMHVFLPSGPGLEFAALIPKGNYVTVCLLGEGIDSALVESFLESPAVKACIPHRWRLEETGCRCSPKINVKGAIQPYADRLVFIGDCGMTRLYKDGIGAAYRTAKAAATTAVLEGISAGDFERHYDPVYRSIGRDNFVGKILFAITRQMQKRRFARRAILEMVEREQRNGKGPQRMSMVMWDMFTGSAPYKEIFLRTLHPVFLLGYSWAVLRALFAGLVRKREKGIEVDSETEVRGDGRGG